MTITATTKARIETSPGDRYQVNVVRTGPGDSAALRVTECRWGFTVLTIRASSLDELHQLVVDIDHAITRARNTQAAQRGSSDQ